MHLNQGVVGEEGGKKISKGDPSIRIFRVQRSVGRRERAASRPTKKTCLRRLSLLLQTQAQTDCQETVRRVPEKFALSVRGEEKKARGRKSSQERGLLTISR